MDVSRCNVMIDWASLDLPEVVSILTLCWKCLGLTNQVNLQDNVFEVGRWWYWCYRSCSYVWTISIWCMWNIWMVCLCKTCKVWEVQRFGLQSSRVEVLWTVMVFLEYEGFWETCLHNKNFWPFSFQMASLFIENVWEDERVCFTSCGILVWLRWNNQIMWNLMSQCMVQQGSEVARIF